MASPRSLLGAAGEQQDFRQDAPQVPAEPPVNGAVFSLLPRPMIPFLDELLGQFGALARRHLPANDIAAEDVEDDVQVKYVHLAGRAAW